MPLYDVACYSCGAVKEIFVQGEYRPPECCGKVMERQYTLHNVKIVSGYPLWVDKMEDIGKRQDDRGERRSFVHPKVVGAT